MSDKPSIMDQRMGAEEFNAALDILGWSIEDVCRHFIVFERTAYHWRSGTHKVSGPASAFLRYLVKLKSDMPQALALMT